MKPRDFLGTGWKFPIRVDARGRIATSGHEQDIDEAVWIILGTAKGERVMQPRFGCGIHEYAFAPNEPGTRASVAHEVHAALGEFEPRIEVGRVRVEAPAGQPAMLLIRVDYRVRSSNARRNLVYPFYLREA
jgi:phage baseplate assembly protein W